MTTEHDFDDLLLLARREALSDAEARRLRELLGGSAEARLLHAAGLGFEDDARVVAGDDLRLARLVRRAESRGRTGSGRQWLRVAQSFALGALLAGVALGAVELIRSRVSAPPRASLPEPLVREAPTARAETPAPTNALEAPSPPPGAEPSASVARSPAIAPAPSAADVAREEPAAAPSAAAVVDATDATATSPSPSSEPRPSDLESAATVFAAANRSRRSGQRARAIELYRRLEREYPHSAEAAGSAVPLGVLYLQQGDAAAALAAFRRGRAASPGEAAWGEAQALQQLGRTGEERAVLEELLRRQPDSAYASAARKRLADLR